MQVRVLPPLLPCRDRLRAKTPVFETGHEGSNPSPCFGQERGDRERETGNRRQETELAFLTPVPLTPDQRPGGESGRRSGLKPRRLMACRFESGPGYWKETGDRTESELRLSPVSCLLSPVPCFLTPEFRDRLTVGPRALNAATLVRIQLPDLSSVAGESQQAENPPFKRAAVGSSPTAGTPPSHGRFSPVFSYSGDGGTRSALPYFHHGGEIA